MEIANIKEVNVSDIIQRNNLREQVYGYLRSSILKNNLKRGQNVNLDELSRELGVSNTPIRESISLLVQEGLIQYKRNVGFYVIDPSPKEVYEIAELVLFFVLAAYHFCSEQGKLENIIPKMEEELKKQKKALADNDLLSYIEMSHNFEQLLIEGTENHLFLDTYCSKATLLAFMSSYFSNNDKSKLESFCAQHERILELMKEKKEDEVVALMKEHYYKSLQLTLGK